MPTITNINGAPDITPCRCGSWLQHWENFSRQNLPYYCPVNGCYQKDLVGAHVQKAYSLVRRWYIIPLCSRHSESKFNLDVSDTIMFVSADKSETCERV
jgi:hypothetical protein